MANWSDPYSANRSLSGIDSDQLLQSMRYNRYNRFGRYGGMGSGYGQGNAMADRMSGLPHGGGPYYGSGGQQFGQGLGDVFSAISQIMNQRKKDQLYSTLLQNQAGPQYQDLVNHGASPEQAWAEYQNDQDAAQQSQQDALNTEYKKAQIAKLLREPSATVGAQGTNSIPIKMPDGSVVNVPSGSKVGQDYLRSQMDLSGANAAPSAPQQGANVPTDERMTPTDAGYVQDQPQAQPQSGGDVYSRARAAIAQGADPAAVKQRLSDAGYDPSQL